MITIRIDDYTAVVTLWNIIVELRELQDCIDGSCSCSEE